MLCPNYTEELLGLKDIFLKYVERRDKKLYIHIEMQLPNRKTEDMAEYFLGYKDRKAVQHVVIDMSEPFRTIAKSLFKAGEPD
mgnify:CR=1 FL=1